MNEGNDDADQLEQRAAKNGDALSLEPETRQRPKKPEPNVAGSKRLPRDHGTQIAKKAKRKNSSKPE